MNRAKAPRSLRSIAAVNSVGDRNDGNSGRKVSAVAGLMAVASCLRRRSAAGAAPAGDGRCPGRSPASCCVEAVAQGARTACSARRAAFVQLAQVTALPFPNARPGGRPQSLCRCGGAVQGRLGFRHTVHRNHWMNTPKTITVLSKEILEDKNATSLRDVARSTAGITLGTGEGGNAFGDRFFIRGFDARNDVFIDGIRDPAVSIREISSPSRSRSCAVRLLLCRTRHRRRRHQHRDQAGHDRAKLHQG